MPRFDDFVPGKRFRLNSIDPAATPFSKGSEAEQKGRLDALAARLDELQDLLHANGGRRVLLVLQGMDTSGKDGTIRWVFGRTSPLGVRVHAFKAPTEEERARDFLWRCHAVVPRAGELAVWNRSHYEDVLVPTVEGWIDREETERRYTHINHFEQLLTDTHTVLIKCMLHISKAEQRRRLQQRIDDPAKNWKFALGDLDARKQWDAYQKAYERLLRATSTKHAPWYVIPADDKLHRNLMIGELLVERLKAMKLKAPPANPALIGLKVS
ncbi:PPK2 family polyphosphate kinase [Piscinibacterium candidicorallinum]|uniref:PPK2 family polyphosphate kinase n=1 Tax=Piscinibacterium candidicorallinum TaxID=1793872 RepID=A0ABV7H409_9BURK